ncbi:MAG TPA: diguanylate cyclase [Thermoanaerobaculia bacterium]|nr:diguanylate cyclase [Thermoanaerobaculia bacterium]
MTSDPGRSPFPPPEGESKLAILAEIARIATETLELRPMLQRVTDALVERLGWELVALVRLERERERFVCEAFTATVPTTVGPGFSREFGSGVVGRVAETGEALVIDDASEFPGFIEVFPNTRSELCAPIRHRGEVVGVINLESPRLAAFRGQLPLVEAIAGQISGAIASARLYEATRQRALHFEVLSEVSRAALAAGAEESGAGLLATLEAIATYVQQRFDFLLVVIVVIDETGQEWAHRAFVTRDPVTLSEPEQWPVSIGVVGRAVRLGASQLVLDVTADPDYVAMSSQVTSEFIAPIRSGDRVIGAFSIENDDAAVFSPENLRLLELVADQVAGAIELSLLNQRLSEIKHELEAANDELQQANRSLERLSHLDPLTGVANRRRFEHALELEWQRLARSGKRLSLVIADVDHFKAYNDARGHIAGDRCLQRVAGVLQEAAQRASDLVARYGGEEFAVVLAGSDGEAAMHVAEQVRAGLEALAIAHPTSPVAPHVTISLGVASAEATFDRSPAELVAAADRALYRAKHGGRNCVVLAKS